jgi:hypothetical protein
VEDTDPFGEMSAGADCSTAASCSRSWYVTQRYWERRDSSTRAACWPPYSR